MKITATGMSQKALHTWMGLVETELTAIGTTLASVKAIYDAHTHETIGNGAAACRSSTPDTGAAEGSLTASAASAITDTSGNEPDMTDL